jgi:hypothetical protein
MNTVVVVEDASIFVKNGSEGRLVIGWGIPTVGAHQVLGLHPSNLTV